MGRDSTGKLTAEEAIDEIVADGCEMMLKKTSVMEKLANENRSLFERIVDFFKDWIDSVKAAFDEAFGSGEDAVRAEHAEAVAMTDYFEQQQALWEDLLVGAVRNQAEGTKSAASEGGAVKAAEREIYNPIRERLAKQGLDELSEKLGAHFPLSAQFESTVQNDETPLVTETVKAGSVARGNASLYNTGKNAFRSAYGRATIVDIGQLGIQAYMGEDIVSESIANRQTHGIFIDYQPTLDIIPHLKKIFENSILLSVERVHTDNKRSALYGYRLYNLYKYETISNGVPVTETRAIVGTIVQNVDGSSNAYSFQNIENVTIGQGFNPNDGSSQSPSGDTYTIAQLYNAVKDIERNEGGLRYSTGSDRNKLFYYTERDDGVKYSERDAAP